MYLTQPEFWKVLSDDFSGDPEEFEPQPVDSPYVAYVTVHDGERFLGFVIVNKHSEVQVELHNALLPAVGWKTRVQVGREFILWLWAAGRKRIIVKVLASNRYSLKYTEFIGMKQFGVNSRSFLKDGLLQDEVWFGISAPEGAS